MRNIALTQTPKIINYMTKQFTLLKKMVLTAALALIGTAAMAQQLKITGTVTDAGDGLPLVGVSVVDPATRKGAVTDAKGQYSITVENDKSQLSFSFVGKETKTLAVGAKQVIDVALFDDANTMDDVVVIGYGVVTRSDLTGAVATMKGKEIAESGTASFTSALTGKLAGVSAVQNGGAPGSAISLKVRGASSVSGGTDPLYVIDGMMIDNANSEIIAAGRRGDEGLDPLAAINPNDIQSIEVLKDASATAIYGSRGANGVIIITTKSGTKDGSNTLNFTADWTFNYTPQVRIDVLNGYDYEDYMRILHPLPDGYIPGVTDASDIVKKYWNQDGTPRAYSGINNVWQDQVMQNGALTQNYNLSLRGSAPNRKTTYAVTAGYLDMNGIVMKSDMTRFTYSMKLENQFTKWMRIGASLNGANVENNGIISADTQTNGGVFTQMLIYRPNVTPEDSEAMDPDVDDPANPTYNPMNNINKVTQNTILRRMQGSAWTEVSLWPKLKLKLSFSGYTTDVKTKNNYPSDSGPGRVDKGRITHASSRNLKWINDNILTYDNTFCKKHRLNVMGGITFEKKNLDSFSITGTGIQDESLGPESIWTASILTPVDNTYEITTQMSYIARVNYEFDKRYAITATFRADGSSRFPVGQKFAYFPSGAFAWKIHEERFMKQVKTIDQLKLRLSYGQTGNQSIPSASAMAMMRSVYYSWNQTGGNPSLASGLVPDQIGNDQLTWEITDMYNAGVDLSLFNSRINLTTDVYYKYTRDLLVNRQLPGSSGYQKQMNNIGTVENRGLEITLNTENISNKNFRWTTDLNFTINRNKVVNIGGGNGIPVTPTALMQGAYSNVFWVKEGLPIGAIFAYKTDGLYKFSDFTQFYDANGKFISDPAQQQSIYKAYGTKGYTLVAGAPNRGEDVGPGYVKMTDPGQMIYMGSAEPKFYGGFTNRFSYKSFELMVFFNYSYGNKLFNASHGILRRRGDYNVETDFYRNMWTIDQSWGKYAYYGDSNGRTAPTDVQVEDASYIKLKEVQLSYRFSSKLCSKIGMKALRVYVSGRNLYTWTNYSWYDPEYASNDPLKGALDKFSYPTPRTLMFGVVMDF